MGVELLFAEEQLESGEADLPQSESAVLLIHCFCTIVISCCVCSLKIELGSPGWELAARLGEEPTVGAGVFIIILEEIESCLFMKEECPGSYLDSLKNSLRKQLWPLLPCCPWQPSEPGTPTLSPGSQAA